MSNDDASRPAMKPTERATYSAGVSPRKREILEIAAQLFARNGYRGTSVRDIGEKAGVLGGSLYHHIKSKDALFVELHGAALDAAADRISAAIAGLHDPWERLAKACEALLDIQLDPDSLTLPLMNDFREVPDGTRALLIAKRDEFEDIFTRLVEDLALPQGMDKAIYRISLVSLINSAGSWYRPGRLSPAQVAAQISLIFRH